MAPMAHVDDEIQRLEEMLRVAEEKFEHEMRSRGFDPTQHENLALTSSLAKLYQECEELKMELSTLKDQED